VCDGIEILLFYYIPNSRSNWVDRCYHKLEIRNYVHNKQRTKNIHIIY